MTNTRFASRNEFRALNTYAPRAHKGDQVRLTYRGYATDGELGEVISTTGGAYTIELSDGGVCYRQRDEFTLTGFKY